MNEEVDYCGAFSFCLNSKCVVSLSLANGYVLPSYRYVMACASGYAGPEKSGDEMVLACQQAP